MYLNGDVLWHGDLTSAIHAVTNKYMEACSKQNENSVIECDIIQAGEEFSLRSHVKLVLVGEIFQLLGLNHFLDTESVVDGSEFIKHEWKKRELERLIKRNEIQNWTHSRLIIGEEKETKQKNKNIERKKIYKKRAKFDF